MPEQDANPREPRPRGIFDIGKRTGMGALFFLILLIPRFRRLRRRVWVWSLVRAIAGLSGGALILHYARAHTGAGFFMGGVVLIAFGLLLRSKPQAKSVEERAREFGALVVLNGGTYLSGDGALHPGSQIFVLPERLLVLDALDEPVGEIPLVGLKRWAASRASSGAVEEGAPWELILEGESGSFRFRYEGFFAEHLARIAETTLRNLRAQELPVLK